MTENKDKDKIFKVEEFKIFRGKERQSISEDLFKFLMEGVKNREQMRLKIKELSISHNRCTDTIDKIIQNLKRKHIILFEKKDGGYSLNKDYDMELMQNWRNVMKSVKQK